MFTATNCKPTLKTPRTQERKGMRGTRIEAEKRGERPSKETPSEKRGRMERPTQQTTQRLELSNARHYESKLK